MNSGAGAVRGMSSTDMLPGASGGTDAPLAQEKEERKFLGKPLRFWIKLGLFLVFVALILIAIFVFQIHKKLDDILDWIRDHKAPGFFIFAGTYTLLTALLIPGSILSIGAGFVFDWHLGTVAVLLGATVGQTIAFLEGRYFLRDWIAEKTQHFKTWQAIEAAVQEEGWKIVGLLRLAPVIPYNVLNPALGLTAVKFWDYTIASAVAIIPGTVLYVYLGSLASDFSEITGGDAIKGTTLWLAIASGVVIILVVVLITYYAKRAIKKRLNIPDEENTDATDDNGQKRDIENPGENAQSGGNKMYERD